MPITPVSPTSPAMAVAQGADATTAGLVLQPGSVISARVLGVLADNWVRIAIADLSLDVMSEVALMPGQNLQLAVSQNDGGIRLAIVGSGAGAGASPDTVALSGEAAELGQAISAAAGSNAAPARNTLTPLEQIAVSVASESAATRQGSQAPLFANLAAAVTADLPPALQKAVGQVLAQQTLLNQGLSGQDVQTAFEKSGLFLESSLASGMVPGAGAPDLKAALIVLRQALTTSLAASPNAGAVPGAASQPAVQAAQIVAPGAAGSAQVSSAATAVGELAPPLSPEIELGQAAQQRLPSTAAGSAALVLTEALAGDLPRAQAGAALGLPQPTGPDVSRPAGPALPGGVALPNARTDVAAPPPFRGALPSAQPVASPSIGPNGELSATAHRLLDNTDAAIARQTLLQVASLPDRAEAAGQRADASTPQWNFEIPFVTPQGTAMAQFAISRDGGSGNEAEPGQRVWRARFSLNVEPAGPVHALISLAGERTSVRMWAERPATAAQLRAGAGELSQALSRAELKPGDIVIREGTPPQATPPQAGHFLDRAL